MTDAEIIKALEWCTDTIPPCHACKYDEDTYTSDECMGELMKDALDLINRQKAEIEELTTLCEMQDKNMLEQMAEIERFKKEIHNAIDEVLVEIRKAKKLYVKDIARAKSEARKEFVKNFEKKIKDVNFTLRQTWEIQCALKEVLEEMECE